MFHCTCVRKTVHNYLVQNIPVDAFSNMGSLGTVFLFFSIVACCLDPRLIGWPLVDSPVPMLTLLSLYLLFVLVGPQVMKHRQPLNVKVPMMIYNFCMVVFSYYMFHEVWSMSCYTRIISFKFKYLCENCCFCLVNLHDI